MENIRPTFLTVLCVLTFIGSGWSIFSGISNYTSADEASGIVNEQFEEMQEKVDLEEGGEMISKLFDSLGTALEPEKIKNAGMATAITSILTLIGAVLMWSLRKTGFYIYVIGAVAAIIAPMVIYGGLMGAAAGGFTAFFGILFIVLYALNLKYLR